MSKRIIAVNAGPRKGWNTDSLITEASRGAESAGAAVERFDLFRLEGYRNTLSRFVGPTQVLISGDTLQLRDYSKTDWPWFFDAQAKYARHETGFPEELKKAFAMGAALAE